MSALLLVMACITSFRSAERMWLDGNAVLFCDDETPKKQQCFSTDLSTGKATSAKFAHANVAEGPKITIDGKRAKVCAAGCKTLKPKARVDEGLAMHGVTNGKLAVLINRSEVETFDVKTGKRIAGFSAGKGDCTSVTILSDTLLVQNQFCGEDDKGTHWFATKKGKRVAVVGGDKPVHVTAPALVGGQVAFVAFTGDSVVVHDAITGALANRIPIGNAAAEAWPMIAGNDKKLVVVFGGERAGDLAVIDRATEKVTSFTAQRCN